MACSEVLKDIHTRDAPWSDDLDVGLEAVEGKLEADLVVTPARASVRDEANGKGGLRQKGLMHIGVALTRSPRDQR